METIRVVRSIRRSSLRARLLLSLAHHGKAYPQLLAEELEVSPRDLRRALYGDMPKYALELSPIRLRLVRRGRTGDRSWYEITAKGRRVAREVARLRGRR